MPSSNLEPLEFLNVVGRMDTATRRERKRKREIERKRDVYLRGDISDSRKRRSLCAQPATADVDLTDWNIRSRGTVSRKCP